MKRVLFGILAAVLVLALIGCGQAAETEQTDGKGNREKKTAVPANPQDFESIKITESGTKDYSTGYLAQRTDNGVHLEYYIYRSGYDYETGAEVEDKRVLNSYDGDEEAYHQIALAVGAAQMETWNGFSGTAQAEPDDASLTDPAYQNSFPITTPTAQTGASFTLEVKLSNGKTVSASGTGNYPEGYRSFLNAVDEVCSSQPVSETSFNAGDYKLSLPESRIGNVYAVFRDGRVGFEIRTSAGNQMLANFYEAPYDYAGKTKGYSTIISFLKDYSTWFVKMRSMQIIPDLLAKMTNAQKALCSSLDADMAKVSSSLSLNGEYEIVANPEEYEETTENDYVTNYNFYVDPNSGGYTDTDPNAPRPQEGNGQEGSGQEGSGQEGGGEEGGGEQGGGEEGGGQEGGGEEGGGQDGGGEEDGGGYDGGDGGEDGGEDS